MEPYVSLSPSQLVQGIILTISLFLFIQLLGLHPNRYGNRGHLSKIHFRTSAVSPQQQSIHFSRIALDIDGFSTFFIRTFMFFLLYHAPRAFLDTYLYPYDKLLMDKNNFSYFTTRPIRRPPATDHASLFCRSFTASLCFRESIFPVNVFKDVSTSFNKLSAFSELFCANSI